MDSFMGETYQKRIDKKRFVDGIFIQDLLYEVGLVASDSEARKLIAGGGAYVNHNVVDPRLEIVDDKDLIDDKVIVSAGRKRHVIVWAV